MPSDRPRYFFMESAEYSLGMSTYGFTAIRMLATNVWETGFNDTVTARPRDAGVKPRGTSSSPYLLLDDLSLYCLTPTCSLMTCLCTV